MAIRHAGPTVASAAFILAGTFGSLMLAGNALMSMTGPLTTVAPMQSKVVAGVELWQQLIDRFWSLEGLIRDQAPEFKGVGADVVGAGVKW